MMPFIFLLWLFGNQDIVVLNTFQPPTEDEFLGVPSSMSFSPGGRLFIANQNQARILIWNPDGSFAGGFGRQGQGPGEITNPLKIQATEKEVYVWDQAWRLSIFDHEGHFKRFVSLPVPPRKFTELNSDLFLLGYQTFGPKGIHVFFDLYDGDGNKVGNLKHFPNNVTLSRSGRITVKAFGPEIDIQNGNDGYWYFGFSQDSQIFKIDSTGKIVDSLIFKLPSEKPTDEDRDFVKNQSFVGPTGKRIRMNEGPKTDFSHDKAFYTNLFIRGDKIAFVLTSIGSTNIPNGFYRGTFMVSDFKSKTVSYRGSFHYPEDSRVFFRDGRALAIILDEDKDQFQVKEISLKGM